MSHPVIPKPPRIRILSEYETSDAPTKSSPGSDGLEDAGDPKEMKAVARNTQRDRDRREPAAAEWHLPAPDQAGLEAL